MELNIELRSLVPPARDPPGAKPPIRQDSAMVKEDPVGPAPQPSGKPSKGELDAAVQQLNAYVQDHQRDLQFGVDPASGRQVVKILDAKSQEVIWQLPSKEVLAMSQQLAESQQKDAEFSLLKTSA